MAALVEDISNLSQQLENLQLLARLRATNEPENKKVPEQSQLETG